MHEFRRQVLLTTFKLFDLLIVTTMFLVAAAAVYFQTNSITFSEFLDMRFKIENFLLFVGFLLLWHTVFSIFGLYRSRRLLSIWSEIKDLIVAASTGALAIYLLGYFFDISITTPLFLVIFWSGTTITTIFSRVVLRYMLKKVRFYGHNLRFLVIVGTNERARKFARKIESKPELGYRLLGFVDDKWCGNGDLEDFGWNLVSNLNNFNSYMRDNVVDEVVIALPMKSFYWEASQIFSTCEEQGVMVRNLTDIFNPKLTHSTTEEFEGIALTTHYAGATQGWQVVFKRIMDLTLSAVLLVVLLPLLLVAALLIKLDSPGPVFFSQERVGLNKRRFKLLKFRTMVNDAEKKQDELEVLNEASGPVFKIKNDPRITKIGHILRKTSIDELPQLINVLQGNMSLVGPRPLPVRDYNGFNQDWHRRRFSVRPGITCTWQVNGRSEIPFERWMQLDMDYIDHWSLWLDITIIAKTIPAVIRGSGAA